MYFVPKNCASSRSRGRNYDHVDVKYRTIFRGIRNLHIYCLLLPKSCVSCFIELNPEKGTSFRRSRKSTVKSHVKELVLYNFIRDFRWVYKRGGGGLYIYNTFIVRHNKCGMYLKHIYKTLIRREQQERNRTIM